MFIQNNTGDVQVDLIVGITVKGRTRGIPALTAFYSPLISLGVIFQGVPVVSVLVQV